ncbi:MAG: PrsW family glutamic-type intramembrane protease [Actinomycetota bacterium]|nr:PrsW family glutamic-type intramembrane protease [Actinomycetota bacterium]
MSTSAGRRRYAHTADVVLLAVLLLGALLAYLVDFLSRGRSPFAPLALGLVLALIPPAVWLTFFYRRDRLEPEPLSLVATVFVASALVASGVAEPLIRLLPQDLTGFRALVASITVIGVIREFSKYLVVRLLPGSSGNINERADGVVYGTTAGLGYATVLNLQFVITSGGTAIGPGFIWMSVVALAHAALGGMVGYLCARDLREQTPLWWLPAGLLVAASLDGIFFTVRSEVVDATNRPATGAPGASHGSLLGILLAAVVAFVISWLLARAMAREEPRSSA